jgi:hypothetical protein
MYVRKSETGIDRENRGRERERERERKRETEKEIERGREELTTLNYRERQGESSTCRPVSLIQTTQFCV